jgi:hypothetical protein
MTTPTQLETTPRVYYEHYMTATPSYDLYPGLSRRLGNGYVHRPVITRPNKKQQQTNFIFTHTPSSVRRYNQDEDPLFQPVQQETPSWDLYPAILRNVSFYISFQAFKKELTALIIGREFWYRSNETKTSRHGSYNYIINHHISPSFH